MKRSMKNARTSIKVKKDKITAKNLGMVMP
jgi:hypothetical protein